VPFALVSYSSSSTASVGPSPQGTSKVRLDRGCGVRYWSRAGMYASVRPTGSCRSSSASGLWTVIGAVSVMVMSSRSVVIGSKRTTPFSSTPAIVEPSGELMSTSVGRVESPPAGASTISPTACLSGQRRWMVGLSPAIQAVDRLPSVRLRGESPVPSRAVESAVAVIRFRCSGATLYSSSSSSSLGTGIALAFTSYVPADSEVQRRCSPASVPVGEKPPGSVARCSETTSAAASVRSASVGSRSMRVTWTSGMVISEKPAPDRSERRAAESTMVTFSQLVAPSGALMR
jgi:hypothetical protein